MKILRVLRAIQGNTQMAMTQKTGIPDWKISLFEAGFRTPNKLELVKLSDAFGVSPELLQSTIKIEGGELVVTQ